MQAARAGEATMNDAERLPLQGGDPSTLEGPQVCLAILSDGKVGGRGPSLLGRLRRAGRRERGEERAYWEGRAARTLICLVSSFHLQAARAGEATMNDAERLPLQEGDPSTLKGPQVWLVILLDGKAGGRGPRLLGRLRRAGRRGRG